MKPYKRQNTPNNNFKKFDKRKPKPKPKLPKDKDKDMDDIFRAKMAKQSIAWKQGNIWVQIYPPYDESGVYYSLQVPKGINRVKGPKQGWRKIHDLGGTIGVDAYDEWVSWFSADPEGAGGITLGNIGKTDKEYEVNPRLLL